MAKLTAARIAFEQGKTRYSTGKPCIRGHLAERMVRNGACVECLRLQRQRYRIAHPEKRGQIVERYRTRHIEDIRQRDRDAKRRIRAGSPERNKERLERWRIKQESKLAEIAGRPRQSVCELCGESGRTVFDHCHTSGAFRGWLCDRCNKVLGLVHDSPVVLARMIEYLTRSSDGKAHQQTA